MNLTTLFRLRKPEGTDPVNIEDFNDNFDVIDEELGKRLESTGAASDMTVAFTQASTRANLKTGEKISVSFGKIMKYFADLKNVSFSGSYSDLSNKPTIPSGAAASQAVANNCTTTAAGSVLDARQGKVLMDKANQLNSDLTAAKQSFQAGVDTLYDKCVDCGATPASSTPTAISTAIQSVYTNRYNAGVNATKKGNAVAGNVLSGKTFTSSSAGVNVSGTMANRGALNWSPSGSESKTVSAGYYSGGTLNSANAYNAGYSAGKTAATIKVVSKSAEYPMAGVNGEQTVDFSVDFGAVSGYKLTYAGITALDTYMSNGTIKYVQFSNLRISGTKATWSVHTQRGTGGGNNTCTVQGIFVPA